MTQKQSQAWRHLHSQIPVVALHVMAKKQKFMQTTAHERFNEPKYHYYIDIYIDVYENRTDSKQKCS